MFGLSQEASDPKAHLDVSPVETGSVLFASVGTKRGLPCSLYYEIFGEGPQKILFIMGLCMPRQAWQPQTEYFASQPQYQVCVFDNRGHGDSVSSVLYTSTAILAQDTRELLDHLRWSKCHVVGLSMGGMIAQELALLIPERISSLTLAVTHAGGRLAVMPGFPGTSPRTILDMLRWAAARTKEEKVRALLPFCYSQKFLEQYEEMAFDWHMETYRHVHLPSLMAQLYAVLGHYITYERMKKLKASPFSIMTIGASEDRVVRVQNTIEIHKLLGSKLVLFKGCGHMINLECPERCVKPVWNG